LVQLLHALVTFTIITITRALLSGTVPLHLLVLNIAIKSIPQAYQAVTVVKDPPLVSPLELQLEVYGSSSTLKCMPPPQLEDGGRV
jgi:hypothetical protein